MAAAGIIYLDHQAHSPIDPRVLRSLHDAYRHCDFNPHSAHGPGEVAKSALEGAREKVAGLIGASAAEIILLSGATEANNLAFAGMAPSLRRAGRTRILVSAGEHPSVLAAAEAMDGFKVERLSLNSDGLVDLTRLEAMLGTDVGLVSVALANHEVGSVQLIDRIAPLTMAAGALLHSDLAQAAGKVPVCAGDLDLASLSSHKMGGPSGVGALYIRRRLRRRLVPVLVGGGQEGGARAGTVPVPLCVAFGTACGIAAREMRANNAQIASLRDGLLDAFRRIGRVVVNGGMEHRLAGNLNVSFAGIDGEALVVALRERIAFSTGSACTSTALEPSHVLLAIGADPARARGAVRFGLGPATTAAEIAEAAEAVGAAVRSLRAMNREVA